MGKTGTFILMRMRPKTEDGSKQRNKGRGREEDGEDGMVGIKGGRTEEKKNKAHHCTQPVILTATLKFTSCYHLFGQQKTSTFQSNPCSDQRLRRLHTDLIHFS